MFDMVFVVLYVLCFDSFECGMLVYDVSVDVLCVGYWLVGGVMLFDGIDLYCLVGGFVVIVGFMGVGKSMLFGLFVWFDDLCVGCVLFGCVDVWYLSEVMFVVMCNFVF